MTNQINVVMTTSGCDKCNATKGNYQNDELYIDITCIPNSCCISTDEPFSANKGERCLNLLSEKLRTCKELLVNGYVMKYHNHSPTDYFIGGLEKETFDECFIAIHYCITYSLHKLD
ncbi:hypothetical protein FHW88_002377 [Mucilaginibacter sp. SG538B]|nr:hypothetical protein [Mucilaginibacter sp. SG538B]